MSDWRVDDDRAHRRMAEELAARDEADRNELLELAEERRQKALSEALIEQLRERASVAERKVEILTAGLVTIRNAADTSENRSQFVVDFCNCILSETGA